MPKVASIEGQHHALSTVQFFICMAFKAPEYEIFCLMAFCTLAWRFRHVGIEEYMSFIALDVSHSHMIFRETVSILDTRNTQSDFALFVKVIFVDSLSTLHTIFFLLLLQQFMKFQLMPLSASVIVYFDVFASQAIAPFTFRTKSWTLFYTLANTAFSFGRLQFTYCQQLSTNTIVLIPTNFRFQRKIYLIGKPLITKLANPKVTLSVIIHL